MQFSYLSEEGRRIFQFLGLSQKEQLKYAHRLYIYICADVCICMPVIYVLYCIIYCIIFCIIICIIICLKSFAVKSHYISLCVCQAGKCLISRTINMSSVT